MTKSDTHGINTSPPEVSHISSQGLWVLVRDREIFISFKDFPWFREAPVGSILNIEEPTLGHYYWPELDIDLSDEIITHPDRFPRISKQHSILKSRDDSVR
ncbi:MAG: DUF2442 domain-containing protein [Leptospirillum sp.]